MLKTSNELKQIAESDLHKVLNTEIVYQYSNFDIALNNILIDQTLKFSDPTTFNDPFDCNEKLLHIDYNDKLVEKTLSELDRKLSRKEKREAKRKIYKEQNQNQYLGQKRKEYKISCFSEFYNKTLMWSHYADKHNGICVGFSFPYLYDNGFILCPVKYLNELKPLAGDATLVNVILYWLTSKSENWKYESEIRAIRKTTNKESYEYFKYDKKYIKEIVFGCNVSNSQIKYAINLLKNNLGDLSKITFKRMVINKATFSLADEIVNV